MYIKKNPTYVSDENEVDFVHLSPNPTLGKVELIFNQIQSNVTILVLDISGRVLIKKEMKGLEKINLNLSFLPAYRSLL